MILQQPAWDYVLCNAMLSWNTLYQQRVLTRIDDIWQCHVGVFTCCKAEAETGGCWGCCCMRPPSGQEGVAGLGGAALALGSF